MKSLNLKAVQEINEKISSAEPDLLIQAPGLLYELCLWCASAKAFTGEQMAIAKKEWQDMKVRAYQNFILSSEANKERVDKFGVMVVKDYINAKCGDYEARYEFIERTNNAAGYLEDACRTIISALKEEMRSK